MNMQKRFKIPIATMSIFGEVVQVPKYYQEHQFDFESFKMDSQFFYITVYGTQSLFDALNSYEDVTEVP